MSSPNAKRTCEKIAEKITVRYLGSALAGKPQAFRTADGGAASADSVSWSPARGGIVWPTTAAVGRNNSQRAEPR
jgi:hypothetical protein